VLDTLPTLLTSHTTAPALGSLEPLDRPRSAARPGRRRLGLVDLLRTAAEQWDAIHDNARLLGAEFRAENLRRLRYMASIVVPLNVLHVLFFLQSETGVDDTVQRWRHGVVMAHLGMALVLTLLGLLAHGLLTRWRSRLAEQVVVVVALMAGLGFGGLLGVIDQWVTPSITPVLVSCLGVGLVFLVRPGLALVLFGAAGALIATGLGLTQHNAAVLLSNRVNTLTGVFMGAALAILLWHKSAANTLLRRQLQDTNLTLQRHPAGDAVLEQVARHLLTLLRRYDVLARFGGEEFMLLLPDTDLTAARAVAEKLRAAIEALPLCCETQPLRVTASLGVTASLAGEDSFQPLYQRADRALYRAKQAGRNQVRSADAEPGVDA
jgi:diguanylate cyclase (GGDEF)-like protein